MKLKVVKENKCANVYVMLIVNPSFELNLMSIKLQTDCVHFQVLKGLQIRRFYCSVVDFVVREYNSNRIIISFISIKKSFS